MMNTSLKLFLLLFALLTGAGAHGYTPTNDEYRFRVYYDDKPIGSHAFTVISDVQSTRVVSEARFVYKLLFVPVYRYKHLAEEVWEDGCLTELRSTTRDNGTAYAVSLTGSELEDAFNQGCPGSFAYWDLEKLKRTQLINSQTGAVFDLVYTREGSDIINGVEADRYKLIGDGLQPITVWYRSSDRRWVALETQLEDGRLRYEESRDRLATAGADRAAENVSGGD